MNKVETLKKSNKPKNSIDTGNYIETNKDTLLMILERYIEQKNKDGITSDRTYLRDTETLNQIKKLAIIGLISLFKK